MLQLAISLKEGEFQLCEWESSAIQLARSLKEGEFQLCEWESSAIAS